MTPTDPAYLTIAELTAILEAQPDPDRVVAWGFSDPRSHRGDYTNLGVVLTPNVTIGSMLAAVREANGSTYGGWKGGDFEMGDCTEVWLVGDHSEVGETLGAFLFSLMLGSTA